MDYLNLTIRQHFPTIHSCHDRSLNANKHPIA
jgi:hypothetical protein